MLAIASRLFVAAAIVCAAYAVALGWMHAADLSAFISYDKRISVALLGAIAAGFVAWAVTMWRRHRAPSVLGRVFLCAALAFVVATLPGRVRLVRSVYNTGGSQAERDTHNALRLLIAAQEERRIRAARYSSSLDSLDSRLLRNVSPDVALAILQSDDSLQWQGSARHHSGVTCTAIVGRVHFQKSSNFLEDEIRCSDKDSRSRDVTANDDHVMLAASSTQSDAVRDGPSAVHAGVFRGVWPEERFDAARTAFSPSRMPAATWDASIGHEFRALASAVDDRVLVGAHGSGWLGSLDARNGRVLWHTRAPNWIHQNPVASHGVVVVGVGDKLRNSGSDEVGLGVGAVAAFDLSDGHLRWFALRPRAVMPAPAISDSSVISADGAGWLEARSLANGDVRWSVRMRGAAVMASPTVRDSIVYVAQSPRFLCAYRTQSGTEIWCYSAPRTFLLGGDATPTVIGGTIYWSLAEPATGWDMLRRGGAAARTYIIERLSGRATPTARQWLFAIDAASGKERWRQLLGGGYEAKGNIAGTAVPFRKSVVITAPLAHTTMALDTSSGRVLWKQFNDAFSRGAVTVVDSLVITSDEARHLHILRATDGANVCSGILPDRPDRSGPAIYGATAIFTGLGGTVFARPVSGVLSCFLGQRP
jgi:outer membrane protein assembly factor BamB